VIARVEKIQYERKDSSKISTLISLVDDPHAILGKVLGEPFLEYRRKWESAINMELELDYPLHVDLELVFACHLKCPMCVYSLPEQERTQWGKVGTKMSFDFAKKLVREGYENGQVALGLNGVMEPLLVKWLPDLVAYARDIGYLDVMFNTAGYLLKPETSKRLIEAGLTRIMISLDATTEEVYNKIRIGSDYTTVISNIENLLKLKKEMKSLLPVVRTSFVKMSYNEHQLDSFISKWGDKVDFVSIQQFGNPSTGDSKTEKERLRAKSIEFDHPSGFQCPQPWARALVRANGTVLPCCDWHGIDLPMGNLKDSTLYEIWNSDEWKKLRKIHRDGKYMDNPICRECAKSLVGNYEQVIPGKAKNFG